MVMISKDRNGIGLDGGVSWCVLSLASLDVVLLGIGERFAGLRTLWNMGCEGDCGFCRMT